MPNTLNERVKHIRKIVQLNQKEFSQRIEISQSALSQIEKGLTSLSFSTIENITKSFNVNCNWLIGGKGQVFNTDEDGLGNISTNGQEIPQELDERLKLQFQAMNLENQYLKQEITFLRKEIELLNKTMQLLEDKLKKS